MIRVLIAASSTVARAGLKSLVGDAEDCIAIGSASAGELVELALELHPDVILWQISPDEDAAAIVRALERQNTILLTSNAALELIRAGAQGVLPPDASAGQIGIAIRAAAAGLGVFSPERLDAPSVSRPASTLTAREKDVLRMIAEGLANKEIAFRLRISDHTVKFHVSALLGKLGAGSRAEAIGAGIRQGIIML
jgi:two-component system nitrate/nitrite response regulator NarL